MQIVIKIDEKLYKDIYSDAEIMIYGGMRSGKTLLATLLRAIRNGTPLPKGHGRLIDADELFNEFCEIAVEPYVNAQTIIPADKDGEDDTD